MTTIDQDWPHIGFYYDGETNEHRLLKNLAARWLIRMGYPPASIEHEHYVSDGGSLGYTDVYAEQDGHEVYVECEVRQCTLSRGGSIPLDKGEDVFMFRRCDHDRDGVFQVGSEVRDIESAQSFPTDAVIQKEVITYERLSDLPTPPTDLNDPE